MKLLPILGDADASTRADRDIWSIERADLLTGEPNQDPARNPLKRRPRLVSSY
jgi:hypothetical protein